MSNLAEAGGEIPDDKIGKNGPEPKGEVIDFKTGKTLSEEEVAAMKAAESKESHPSWQVTFAENGDILGLPPEVTNKDVIVFLGTDGKWWAQNPSPELLAEIRLWRSDWRDV